MLKDEQGMDAYRFLNDILIADLVTVFQGNRHSW